MKIESCCWVCGHCELDQVRASSADTRVMSRSVAITDSHYGTTFSIYRCRSCGFMQCHEAPDLREAYASLVDKEYDAAWDFRRIQMRGLLRTLRKYRTEGKLLDIGAANGVFVDAAADAGFIAEGIEPSHWLQQQAVRRGLSVQCGTFPSSQVAGPYDIVTLIDVIEHVREPGRLVQHIRSVLSPSGLVMVITPDVKSLIAKCLGWRWWHFRVAHLSYFCPHTLQLLFDLNGFKPVGIHRTGWCFPLSYLVCRLNRYLPMRLGCPNALARFRVHLNLGDTIAVFFDLKPKEDS